MDVAKVDRDVAYVAMFQRPVARVCSKYVICFRRMLQSFFIWMLHMFHIYVARVYSKCFSYFTLMLQQVFSYCKLQIFYLDVPYVSYICCKCIFQIFYLL
jgi:hypothetical protein